jgi:hypothetical protein
MIPSGMSINFTLTSVDCPMESSSSPTNSSKMKTPSHRQIFIREKNKKLNSLIEINKKN